VTGLRDFAGRLVLVTGAASGIGRATALACAREGAHLALCDVDEAGLEATAGAARALGRRVLARRVDVADVAQMRAFGEAVHAEHPAVDVLVNNAGVGLGGGFLDTALEDWDWILRINLWGVIHGCHVFLPAMVRRRAGHVVNVASAAAFVASAQLAAYATTKFAVFGLSEALRDELRPHGIGVTAVCPGIIDTAITRTSRMVGPWATPAARETLVRAYRRRGYGPDRVAAHVVRAIRRGREVAPVSPEAWVMYLMKRMAPRLTARMARAIQARQERELREAAASSETS
jgi:NAD(P)-dependent dehydrogenase (short-subunit alcohol dehydrogenase family)